MLKILTVEKGSVGAELGIKCGDYLIGFDGFEAIDELDYLFYNEKEKFSLEIQKKSGKQQIFDIEKFEDETLGLNIEIPETDIKTCHNNCIFCFVAQMPKGLRESLYIKDDDFKYSFMCGNFVTLTNLNDKDIERIIRLKLSPLYISVHTTDENIRTKMMNNRFAGKIKEYIKKLAEGGITLHTQVVLVKNINDGNSLINTAKDLFAYYPYVKTMAVVPCGVTRYREGLFAVEPMDKEYCVNIINLSEKLNKEFKHNFLIPSDEFYFKAEKVIPPYEYYGDFEQIENGVGLTAKFLKDYYNTANKIILNNTKQRLLITGTAAYNFIYEMVEKSKEYIKKLNVNVIKCTNYFFGDTVTCTGLLTGGDIFEAVKNITDYDELIIPSCTLKEFERVFLDGMTVEILEEKLNKKIIISGADGESFFKTLATDKE
jgi:putative radical SAM enzyme (TIGR03279 family)